ncbi:MAG: Tim44/TimA family putative adaptor protein [Roseiarcus sp.]|jgi:predicted lipid-binding transport protein (Tim44 family)
MGNLDISTIVFAIVAIFVVFKLRSVLGTRNGAERPPVDPTPPSHGPGDLKGAPAGSNVIPLGVAARNGGRPDEAVAAVDRWKGFAEPGSAVAAGLDAISVAARGFAPDSFLAGARAAYEMVVTAFAAGDMPTLRRLLAPDVLANFDKAIRARLAAEQTMTTTLVSIDSANIVEARLAGSIATLAVRFAAKLASATLDKSGAPVEGSANEVADHLDIWTFTRDVGSRDPNWLLAATQTVH